MSIVKEIKKMVEERIPPTYLWLHGVLSRFISGFSQSFLAVSGGTTVAKATNDFPALSLKALGTCCLVGGIIEACRFLKDNPLPAWTIEKTLEKSDVPVESK